MGDEAAYREEVLKSAAWCSENNHAIKHQENQRDHPPTQPPLHINGECVERAHTFRFLGVLISADISWSENITAVIKKAQQRLHFLRKYNPNSNLLLTFDLLIHREPADILHHSVTRERLQRVVTAAQKIIGCPLHSLMYIYTSRCLSRAKTITKDSSHPGFDLFDLLPSGSRYRITDGNMDTSRASYFTATEQQLLMEFYEEDMTPAEELALHLNKGRPVMEGIQGGTVTDSVPAIETVRFIQVSGNTLTLLEPPEDDLGEGTSAAAECTFADEETVSLDSRRLETSQTVRTLYAKHLERQIELADVTITLKKRKLQEMELDLEIKRRTFRKLDLEIQKLEREVSISVHTVTTVF
ncbi:hypothetical protein N1851_033990 [Merluccius polli]|uniref:Alkylated DNA repair protein AlkB homologue 8 N-terminal domain-containing protein n=1 Tax=Merluccius polli TaxID=89951 RepID=A0AA47M0F2_MERPO|nr:hypothetical protein N1851_033990 [Merluccius polli]